MISIHTPAKGVTDTQGARLDWEYISIHTPAKGVTLTNHDDTLVLGNFNPHSREGSDR